MTPARATLAAKPTFTSVAWSAWVAMTLDRRKLADLSPGLRHARRRCRPAARSYGRGARPSHDVRATLARPLPTRTAQLADDLDASASAAQLSITTCLVGLAVGQLGRSTVGPARPQTPADGRTVGLSPSFRGLCFGAFATALVALRLVQGLAGAAGIVISRAIARDLYSGRALMIFFSRLLLVAGLAPVVAPILGGQLSKIMSWRGIFGVLAGFGAVLLLAGGSVSRRHCPPSDNRRRVSPNLARLQHPAPRPFLRRLRAVVGLAGATMFASSLARRSSATDLRHVAAGLLTGLRMHLTRPRGRRAGRSPSCTRLGHCRAYSVSAWRSISSGLPLSSQ